MQNFALGTDGEIKEERVITNDDDFLHELDSESDVEPDTPDFLDEFAPLDGKLPTGKTQKEIGQRLQRKWAANEALLKTQIKEDVRVPRTYVDFQRDRKNLPQWLVDYIDIPEGKGTWQRVTEMQVIRQYAYFLFTV